MRTLSGKLTVLALVGLVAIGWPLQAAGARSAGVPPRTQDGECRYGDPLPGGVCPRAPGAPAPETGPDDDDDLSPVIGVALAALAAGAVACAAGLCSKTPTAEKLLKKGPRVLRGLPAGAFQSYGFIRDGWPVVLDYYSPSAARLTITVGKKEVWSQELQPGYGQVAFRFRGADKPKVALFSVQAGDGSRPEERLQIFGIGAGESAVGQIALSQASAAMSCQTGAWPTAIRSLSFGPATLHSRAAPASFSYVRDKLLQKVTADILHYTDRWEARDGRRVLVIDAKRVWRDPSPPLAGPGRAGPSYWDGRDKDRKVSIGLHRLQVRGWQVQGDPDWAAVLSPQSVMVVD